MYRSIILLMILLSGVVFETNAQKRFVSTLSTSSSEKKAGGYKKIINDKSCNVSRGFFNLYKLNGRVYFEMPTKLLNRDMLLGSTVSEISDAGNAITGQKPHYPLQICFSMHDSTSVQIRLVNNISVTDKNETNIQKAIDKSNINAILKSISIEGFNEDRTKILFDMTDFLLGDIYDLSPFFPGSSNTYGGMVARTYRYKKPCSLIDDIKAYKTNVSVSSILSYDVTLNVLGTFPIQIDKPFTAVMNRTFMLLPEEPMMSRISDSRLGVFPTGKIKYSTSENGAVVEYVTNRWRLEPSDAEAFKRGELVTPKKPIVFYIDNAFPAMWAKYIREGIEDWNLAFEKIGFKNAVRTEMYPTNDPEFDPNNLKYTCVVYSPTAEMNAMGPSWVDPRTGEILNASVYIYHNLVTLLRNWRFIQTAAVDASVRKVVIPDEIMGDAIRYVARHEVGHCFGLMHNMAASAAYPTDSLRSATFTQKYGTTASIMDYARFNYVAQPGDLEKGVSLTPPVLGLYDYYAIKWLYQPILEAKTPEDETPILEKMIAEKANDPIYRYGKQQVYSWYDPSSKMEDLGDDAVKASTYGIKNLKYIMSHLNEWVAKDDKDGSFRNQIYYDIVSQYKMYLDNVASMIGGVYLNERHEGDPRPTFAPVSKKEQKRALNFMLQQQDNTTWLDNTELFEELPLIGLPGKLVGKNVLDLLLAASERVRLCACKSENPYTEQEYLSDIFNHVWKPAKSNANLTDIQKSVQTEFVAHLLSGVKTKSSASGGQQSIAGNNTPVQGFEFQRQVMYQGEDLSQTYYNLLMESKKVLQSAKNQGSQQQRDHYAFLLHKINSLNKK